MQYTNVKQKVVEFVKNSNKDFTFNDVYEFVAQSEDTTNRRDLSFYVSLALNDVKGISIEGPATEMYL